MLSFSNPQPFRPQPFRRPPSPTMNKNQPCHSIFLRLGRFARLHRRRFCRALLAGCMVAVSGCGGLGFSAKQAPAHSATQAAAPADEQSPASPATPSAAANRHGDPMEGANRAVLKFNLQVDRLLLKPAARAYRKLPAPARNGTRNFFANLWMPSTIVNNVLQGKFADAGRGLGRFAINSVLGFFGLMDPATEMGLPERREDFGQTLAVWGVPSGPYLMLPFLGPSNLRDAVALAPQNAADPGLGAAHA